MSSAGWIKSFVFELEAYCVNGHATQANASVAAESRRRRTAARRARARAAQSRSQRIDVACTAGSVSHLPLQPKTR